MNNQKDQVISAAELVEVIRRRKMTLFLSFIGVLIPILCYNYFSTPLYEATATVGFENYSKSTVVDFDPTRSLSRASFVTNQIQQMRTTVFAQHVYDELSASQPNPLKLPQPLPSEVEVETYVINEIASHLSIRQINETDFVAITYVSENPALAATIANVAARVLQAINLHIRRQEYASIKNFIDDQIRVVSERLHNAEEALSAYKTRTQITSIDDESREILQRTTQAEVLRNRIKADHDAAQQKLVFINNKLGAQKRDLANAVVLITDPLTAKLKERLIELNVQYSSLQAQGRPAQHPKMVELRAEIEQTRQELVRTTQEALQGEKLKGMIDPVSELKKNLEESILLEVELRALQAQSANLQETVNHYNDRLKKLPGQELELVRLMRDQEVNSKIYVQLLEEHEQARIHEAAEIINIRIIEPAITPLDPARPRKMVNLSIGSFAGVMIGLLLIFGREFMRDSPRTPEEIEHTLHLPVLVSVPQVKHRLLFSMNGEHRRRWLLTPKAADPMLYDAFSHLWSSVVKSAPRNGGCVLTIVSACASEGKSTVAANLSVMAAQYGKKTILIDGDVRRPTLHEVFDVPASPGLTNLVSEASRSFSEFSDHGAPLHLSELEAQLSNDFPGRRKFHSERQAMHVSVLKALQQTSALETLRILSSGNRLVKPHMLWSSPMIEEIIALLRVAADLIVIDSPPVLGMPDASFIASHADGILLCVEAAKTDKKVLQRTVRSLENERSKLMGVVLNKVDPLTTYGGCNYYQKNYKGLNAVKNLF
ncbi:MAG: GumC family protein [bacterium]